MCSLRISFHHYHWLVVLETKKSLHADSEYPSHELEEEAEVEMMSGLVVEEAEAVAVEGGVYSRY